MNCCHRECENQAEFTYDTGAGWAIDVCKTHADLLDKAERGYSDINTEDNIYGWYNTGTVTHNPVRREKL